MARRGAEIDRALPVKAGTEGAGCGMVHLLYELIQVVPGLDVHGIDISQYALEHAKEEVRDRLRHGQAQDIPFDDHEFDMVVSLTTLHNLKVYDLKHEQCEV